MYYIEIDFHGLLVGIAFPAKLDLAIVRQTDIKERFLFNKLP
jgi:hypothetical protein